MNRRFAAFTLVAALVFCFTASLAFAQDVVYKNERPMFVAGAHRDIAPKAGASNLSQWDGTFKDLKGVQRHFVMVGPDPSKNNTTTTIPVVFVPIKFVYGKSNGNKTFDPNKQKFPRISQSVSKTILASPIFQSVVDFKQGGTDLGKTQYIDAFQRGNFWGKNVKKNKKYHV